MTHDVVLRTRRRARPRIALPLCSLLILVLGWAALWLLGRHEAAAVMDAWIGTEAARGRVWTCPDREIAGFPFRIRIACTNPTFAGKLGADSVVASLSGLRAETWIYQPNAVEASATGPLTLHKQDGGPDTTLAWAALNVTVRGLAGDRKRAALVVDGADLKAPNGADGRADRVDLRFGPAVGRPLEEGAYEVWLTLGNGLIPALDAFTGTQDPLALDEKGVLTRVDLTRIAPWQDLVERWREAGGTFDLSTLKIVKGGLHVDAQGSLGVDDGHRLAGRLSAAMSGYEALAARLGVPVSAVSVGGALAHLLNRDSAALPPGEPNGTRVKLPVILSNGRVLIGPVKTGLRLPALY